VTGSGRDPWADPGTPTEPGQPYAGPPTTQPYAPPAPPGAGWPPYAGAPYGAPAPYRYPAPYGYPALHGQGGYPPAQRPRRPGQVITAAVLAFVQGGVVVLASLYLWFFASLADIALDEVPGASTPTTDALATEGRVLAAVGLVSAVLLVAAGVAALNSRSRRVWVLLVIGHAVQVVLSGYWLVRLLSVFDSVSGSSPEASLAAFTFFFAAGPLVSLGLVLLGAGRRWFEVPTGR
jgi:hypothetical protein